MRDAGYTRRPSWRSLPKDGDEDVIEPIFGHPTAPEPDDYKAWYDEAMVASNEAGFVGLSAAETIRELASASPSIAQRGADDDDIERQGQGFVLRGDAARLFQEKMDEGHPTESAGKSPEAAGDE